MSGDARKTFYLETFGCQMNVHDSEKVVGTLVQEGYRQVETVEQADLILYNTCSIRDKAEQKVFHRLADYKKLQAQGKKFGVLGCVAQQEGEKIFERAPHVSLVCGSASYRNLPQMLVQLDGGNVAREIPRPAGESAGLRDDGAIAAGEGAGLRDDVAIVLGESAGLRDDGAIVAAGAEQGRRSGLGSRDLVRITGLDDRQTDKCFETEYTARTNPYRAYITIIEGCDKFCAYCVVPFTRGKERSRTSDSVLEEARRIVDLGYSEIQLLGQNVNSYKDPAGKKSFAELLAAVGEVAGIKRVRFTTSHPRDFGRDIVEAIEAVPALCDHVHLPVQSGSTRVLDAMQRLYTREQYLERIAWMKTAKREISITTDVIVGFPGETEADFAETLSLLEEVGYDGVFSFKYSPRPNTPAVSLDDAIAEEEKSRRLDGLMAKQREIQIASYQKYIGTRCEVMVEGQNRARAQWIGRTSQNKTLNFTAPAAAAPKVGTYAPVIVTASFPNSLVGEMVL
ncbi:MAG TPA: MiaB/RimO family radical SAM methylthiotransferase [Candidatus Sulfotelmatobacter sp.]|nr:MiaB/RimO family radical SAM methylthiotransferase [Candidatus Sulfotelmatobacter sp.]